jgi:fatty acid desaturase
MRPPLPTADLRRHAYSCAAQISIHVGLFLASLAWLAHGGSLPGQLANALLLAFAMVQVGFCAHDVAHRQVARDRRVGEPLGRLLWNLGCGVSLAWWRDKHLRHHRHPNVPGRDPDLYAVLAFDRADAARRRGPLRWIARHQAVVFPVLVAFTALYFQALSLGYLVTRRPRGWPLELATLLARHGALLALAVGALGPWGAGAFLAVHYAAAGVYMGCIFATNHYALPLQESADAERILHITRNVRTGALGDYLFGGLNYQIEHHLYPMLPRYLLRATAAEVRARCAREGLPYLESGWIRAMADVLRAFHDVGRDLRARA